MSLEDNVMRFDKAAFDLAQERVKSAPIDLTWSDFEQLGIVSKRLETEAIEAKRLAQLALVPPVPLKTKSAAPAPTRLVKHFDAYTDALFDALKPIFESYKTKLAALDARNMALESRVLELEASQAAARTVTQHVER